MQYINHGTITECKEDANESEIEKKQKWKKVICNLFIFPNQELT